MLRDPMPNILGVADVDLTNRIDYCVDEVKSMEGLLYVESSFEWPYWCGQIFLSRFKRGRLLNRSFHFVGVNRTN